MTKFELALQTHFYSEEVHRLTNIKAMMKNYYNVKVQ